ncbi:hypothetical protein M2160_007981 [Streptomyces sp. SAI-117]|uniref:DUF2690 domain-containing protein n=1 Tax=unclassified Streptomyces TaxID=2593676 RepID=UPI0024759F32|nr:MULTISPECIES: DUF2690 domain-containing protein [unclassified Streptomyces]MDH6553882.1 hypothetical protein [Streptomyces sp. SAI-041]MDH6572960.1 hypothetical protein [Streptomyces sp. SAI-117]MDH6582078.1 hypothetical protein [Streptomyces sp. SAI-133]
MRNGITWARAAAAILLAGGGLLAATPAQAAATACSGSACDGKDPAVYCQGDARTVESTRLGQALLELRYSPSCRAAWGRISNAGYDPRDQFTPYATVHRNSDGREYSCSVPNGDTDCYTRMVNDANVTSYTKGMWDSGARIYEGRTGSY